MVIQKFAAMKRSGFPPSVSWVYLLVFSVVAISVVNETGILGDVQCFIYSFYMEAVWFAAMPLPVAQFYI